MLQKIKLLGISLTTSILLLIILCLGAQNLNDRQKLKLGFTSTEPLPTGFIIGISIIFGVLGGGGLAAEISARRDI